MGETFTRSFSSTTALSTYSLYINNLSELQLKISEDVETNPKFSIFLMVRQIIDAPVTALARRQEDNLRETKTGFLSP